MLAPGTGGWSQTILHTFQANGDGVFPNAGLIFDRAGNLYGTTTLGGTVNAGTVFMLLAGTRQERVLYNFAGVAGVLPYSALSFDQQHNLYGTTAAGGVYRLTRGTDGVWTGALIATLSTSYASVIFDKAGNLYGVDLGGGAYGHGDVFQLQPDSGGGWTLNVLHDFTGHKDGGGPYTGLTFGPGGQLYGTAAFEGTYGAGVVFQVTPTRAVTF